MKFIEQYNKENGTNHTSSSIKKCRRDYFPDYKYKEPFDGCMRDASCKDCWNDTISEKE